MDAAAWALNKYVTIFLTQAQIRGNEMTLAYLTRLVRGGVLAAVLMLGPMLAQAQAQVTAFKQAVAEAAADDRDLAAFYRQANYQPVWVSESAEALKRRQELFRAIASAELHGLPAARYGADALMAQMQAVRSPRDLGMVEVALSKAFLRLARDMQTGIVVPQKVDSGIKREVPYRERATYLTGFTAADPRGYFRSLPPATNEYARLMKEKLRLEKLLAQGGWGAKVSASSLKPGQSGDAVVALRNRLIAKGFLERSSTRTYDKVIERAVRDFQAAHGLNVDGTAGASTIEELNASVEERLKSIIVAMERERWNNQERGTRHVLVNLTDFSARIVYNDTVTFQTRAVVGKNVSDRRSPEFSDVMEHMVINPTWNVPRSIAVKEYLPMMKRNPNAAGHLKLYDGRGRAVSRANIDFSAYSARNFPFDIKQPPSSRNALGLVKFMFPNKYNIYLHDTPAKNLFSRERRDYSHGCIRLAQPFDFAYEMLSKQTDNPKDFFHSRLKTGRETKVDLEQHVPVHIIYRTAFTVAGGPTQFRRDVYGRDARIWDAMAKAGVSLPEVRG